MTESKRHRVFVPAAFISCLLLVVAVPSYFKAREKARTNACLQNLRMIDSAMTSAALANNISEGQIVPTTLITPFMRGGVMPECPEGADYIIQPLGQYPYCMTHGDLLAKEHGPCVLPEGLRRKEDAQPNIGQVSSESAPSASPDEPSM